MKSQDRVMELKSYLEIDEIIWEVNMLVLLPPIQGVVIRLIMKDSYLRKVTELVLYN